MADLGTAKHKIAGVRLVNPGPARPAPVYKPPADAWSVDKVEVANPMSIYPKYQATRSLFMADPGKVPSFTVELTTDTGLKGYGQGGPGGGTIVTGHLTKLLIGEDPFDVERIWDMMWRSTMSYGRMGVTMNAISGVDLAVWDLIGKAMGLPLYKLLGGATKDRIYHCKSSEIPQLSFTSTSIVTARIRLLYRQFHRQFEHRPGAIRPCLAIRDKTSDNSSTCQLTCPAGRQAQRE